MDEDRLLARDVGNVRLAGNVSAIEPVAGSDRPEQPPNFFSGSVSRPLTARMMAERTELTELSECRILSKHNAQPSHRIVLCYQSSISLYKLFDRDPPLLLFQ